MQSMLQWVIQFNIWSKLVSIQKLKCVESIILYLIIKILTDRHTKYGTKYIIQGAHNEMPQFYRILRK
jgi:hypothetical protein